MLVAEGKSGLFYAYIGVYLYPVLYKASHVLTRTDLDDVKGLCDIDEWARAVEWAATQMTSASMTLNSVASVYLKSINTDTGLRA